MRSAGGLLGIIGFLWCGGCADYWAARGRDLTDCARAGVALGVGLLAEVEATSFVHPTVGLLDVTFEPRLAFTWDPRPSRPQGEVRTAAMPTLLVGWPLYGYHESKSGYDDSHPYLRGAIAPWILMGTHHIERVSHSLSKMAGELVAYDANEGRVSLPATGRARRYLVDEKLAKFRSELKEAFGRPIRVTFEVREKGASPEVPPAPHEASHEAPHEVPHEAPQGGTAREGAKPPLIVERAVEIFRGRLRGGGQKS